MLCVSLELEAIVGLRSDLTGKDAVRLPFRGHLMLLAQGLRLSELELLYALREQLLLVYNVA